LGKVTGVNTHAAEMLLYKSVLYPLIFSEAIISKIPIAFN